MLKRDDKLIVLIVLLVAVIGLTTTMISETDQDSSFGSKLFKSFSKKVIRDRDHILILDCDNCHAGGGGGGEREIHECPMFCDSSGDYDITAEEWNPGIGCVLYEPISDTGGSGWTDDAGKLCNTDEAVQYCPSGTSDCW